MPNQRRKRSSRRSLLKSPSTGVESGDLVRTLLSADSAPVYARETTSTAVQCADLIRRCPREIALSRIYELEAISHIQPAMRIVWALGRAAENHVRMQLTKSLHSEMRSAGWGCYLCNQVSEDYGGDCDSPECSGQHIVYREVTLHDEESGVIGHPDILFTRASSDKVTEIKSINLREFQALKKPKGDHILQAAVYNRLLGDRRSDPVTVLYVAKDYTFGSPYKEYEVSASPYAEQVDRLQESAYEIRTAKEDSLPPRLPACTSPGSKRAKGCHACSYCFAS